MVRSRSFSLMPYVQDRRNAFGCCTVAAFTCRTAWIPDPRTAGNIPARHAKQAWNMVISHSPQFHPRMHRLHRL
jgi:hypothetical protein